MSAEVNQQRVTATNLCVLICVYAILWMWLQVAGAITRAPLLQVHEPLSYAKIRTLKIRILKHTI